MRKLKLKWIGASLLATIGLLSMAQSPFAQCYTQGSNSTSGSTTNTCTSAGFLDGVLQCSGSVSQTGGATWPQCKPASRGVLNCTSQQHTVTVNYQAAQCVPDADNRNCVAGQYTSPQPLSITGNANFATGGPCPSPTPTPPPGG